MSRKAHAQGHRQRLRARASRQEPSTAIEYEAVASPAGWTLGIGDLVLEVGTHNRQTRCAVAVRRGNALLHRDRIDLASAKSRGHFLRQLREERQIEIPDKALLALGEAVIVSASNPPATPVRNGEHPQYESTPEGLVWLKTTRDGVMRTRLTNFTARIVEEIVEDDGVETRGNFEIEMILNGRATRVKVPAPIFAAMNWPMEQAGAAAIVQAGLGIKDHARAAIQCLSGEVPRRQVFGHTGWRQLESRWVYLHGGGAIEPMGPVPADDTPAAGDNSHASPESGVEVILPAPLARYKLPPPPSGDGLVKAVRASLRVLEVAGLQITAPLIAAIARAVIGDNTDFAIHLTGPTGVFKSELAALVQQHFGAGMDAHHLPGSWSSTANSLEGLAFAAKDAILVVDDFAPGGSQVDVQRQHRDADRLLRAQGNTAGRGRMRADATLRPPKPPRGVILSTGEDVPKGQSLRSRMFIVEVSPGEVDRRRLTLCQLDAAAGRYAEALAGFIAYLAQRYDEISADVKHRADRYRKDLLRAAHPRTANTVAHLAAGLHCYLQFAVTIGAIYAEEAKNQWRAGWNALIAASKSQGDHQTTQEPAEVFIGLLRAVLSSGGGHVAGADGGEPDRPEAYGWRQFTVGAGENARDEWRPQGRRIGWLDGDDLYLEPNASYAAAQSLARDKNETIAVSATTLHKRLQEKKLLASTEAGRSRLTVRRMLGGVRQTVLHLHAETLHPVEADQLAHSAQGTIDLATQTNPPIPLHQGTISSGTGTAEVVPLTTLKSA